MHHGTIASGRGLKLWLRWNEDRRRADGRSDEERQTGCGGGDGTAEDSVSDVAAGESEGDALTAEVSADVAPTVGEFMEQAAQQNEAAAEAVPDVKNRPGPYISFEHVYKSFGDFVVLEDVSFSFCQARRFAFWGEAAWGSRFRCRC